MEKNRIQSQVKLHMTICWKEKTVFNPLRIRNTKKETDQNH